MLGGHRAALTQSVQLFCFLDLDHPAVAWAIMRGVMISADYISNMPNDGFISFMPAGMIESMNNSRLFNEYIIDTVRARSFQDELSRMRGMFFFESREDAEGRIGDKNWPGYFNRDNLVEVNLYYNGFYTKVDSNWITFAQTNEIGRIEKSNLDWVYNYWSGEKFNKDPVWEIIGNGVAVIKNESIRRRCYDYIREFFPSSHVSILMARLASESGSDGGLVTPFLLREDESRMRLGYVWRDADFQDPAVIAAIAKHPDAGALGRMLLENETWKMPDFRLWGKVFELRESDIQNLPLDKSISLHRPG